jgi:hypothetical protein
LVVCEESGCERCLLGRARGDKWPVFIHLVPVTSATVRRRLRVIAPPVAPADLDNYVISPCVLLPKVWWVGGDVVALAVTVRLGCCQISTTATFQLHHLREKKHMQKSKMVTSELVNNNGKMYGKVRYRWGNNTSRSRQVEPICWH